MKVKSLVVAISVFTIGLTGCSNSDTNKELNAQLVLDSVPHEGSLLPYTVLKNDLIDGKTQQTFEVRNGGYGSAMTAHPSKATQFYALTDRGPNASYTGEFGNGKIFPTPDYTPRIGLFEVQKDGSIEQLKTILLKQTDGTPITGLPNTTALGGTGETPYNPDGSPILVNSDQAFDETSNPIKLDDYGLDGEGLVALKDGSFWVSDEYGPHMVHYTAEGVEIDRINPFAEDTRVSINLPAEFGNRWANRGMEGLAITPDEKTLVGIMQSSLDNPSKAARGDTTRIVTVNLDTKAISQYIYQQEKSLNSNSEIVAISDTEFLVLERDGAFLFGGPNGTSAAKPNAQKHVYRIDISTGTNLETIEDSAVFVQDADLGLLINGKTLEEAALESWDDLQAAGIQAVEKTLVVDMVAEVQYPHDKMEGFWLIDDERLGILNDDDFATWSTDGVLEQKMLDTNTIDGNRLFIIDNLDLSSHK